MNPRLPPQHIKGRGALSYVPGRFEKRASLVQDLDDFGTPEDDTSIDTPPPTRLSAETARSIISRNTSPDIGFSQSVNLMRGCEHGCVYCFARPSHAYLDLSPGLDFERQLFYKHNAIELLRRELSRPGYVPHPIALGINTDGYQPRERELELTRQALEVLLEFRHPLHIVTKGVVIHRDLDLLAELAKLQLVHVNVSVTSLDNRLSSKLEPRAASPTARLRMLEALAQAGVPTGVLVAPVIPMLTDMELEHILDATRSAGAQAASYILLRLPHELKDVWDEWLQHHYPARAAHIHSLMRQLHDGALYRSEFGTRMRGTGPFAQLLEQRFRRAHAKFGFGALPPLNRALFKPPQGPQADLFG